jgi:hypothetical protein
LAAAVCLSFYPSATQAGTVDFVAHFEPSSSWTNNTAAQTAMNEMLGQFEAFLVTGGSWNAVVEVYFTDNETSAYASSSPGSTHTVTYKSKQYRAVNAWTQIVQGLANPNGVINTSTGANADIIVNWNFALSTPQNNKGLLRHELMHGLGMSSGLPMPTLSSGGTITRPGVGTMASANVYDAAFVDLNGNPFLGAYGGTYSSHTINSYAVDNDWGDANGSGLAFRGISDSGAVMDMALYSYNPSGGSNGGVDGSHVYIVSYANKHPTWSTIAEVDRAFLRGLGYRGAGAWQSTQLTANPNAAAGSRTGAAHASAYLYFYKGTDSNIWASFWNGGQWAQAPLTSDANVDDWLYFGTAYKMLFYKGKDNRLWTLYFNGSVWTRALLGTNANVGGDVTVDDTWNLIHYRGTDSRVWTTWWTGSQWAQAPLSGSANVVGGLAVDTRHHLVYYQGTGNEMWCHYWTGAAWVQTRLGTASNVSGTVAADSGGGMAYYRSSADNTAWAVYWNGIAWAQTQIDALAGMGSASPIAPYISPRVGIYINSGGQCCAEFWSGSRWTSGVLGDGGSGLTGGLSVQRSGNLIFARRSDGHVVIFYYQ